MAKRPVRYDANLPRNLTYRKRDRLYSWRNPVTGQEISLGRIDRKDAVAQAIEANNYIDQNYLPSSLLDRIKDVPTFTVAAWLERYEVILERRELKPNTMKVRRNQIATIKEEFGKIPSLLSRQRTSPHSLKRTFSVIKRAWLPGSGLC